VVSIEAWPAQGIVVKTADRLRALVVPDYLEGFDEVKRQLVTWAPTVAAKPLLQRSVGRLLSVTMIVAWIGAAWAPAWLGLVCVMVLTAIVVYFVRAMIQSRDTVAVYKLLFIAVLGWIWIGGLIGFLLRGLGWITLPDRP
jgi:hypothetical protein